MPDPSPQGDALLIFGVAGVGKSTVARHCALRWRAKRYVDVATLREALRPQHPELRQSVYDSWQLAGPEYSARSMVRGFEGYADLLWPMVMRILQSSACEQNDLVLEGTLFSVRRLASLKMPSLRLHPRMLCVRDAEQHFARLNGSLKKGSAQERRLGPLFSRVRALQDHLAAECRAFGIPLIENQFLEETLDRVLAGIPALPSTTEPGKP